MHAQRRTIKALDEGATCLTNHSILLNNIDGNLEVVKILGCKAHYGVNILSMVNSIPSDISTLENDVYGVLF